MRNARNTGEDRFQLTFSSKSLQKTCSTKKVVVSLHRRTRYFVELFVNLPLKYLFSMQKLTQKEEEVMEFIWQLGSAAPKDVLALYDDPKPSVNTIATSFQSLEKKGYLRHEAEGRGFRYFPLVEQKDYGKDKFQSFVSRYFSGSYKQLISAFVKDENVSREELMELLDDLSESN